MFSFKLTNIAAKALIHGGVGAEAWRQFPGVPAASSLVSLVRSVRDGPEIVDASKVGSWHYDYQF